ncbi:hypothetical protein GUJ93_ZPchr0007g6349 [Zizania palustris]|uniref:Uncharacterized protein n=1 Tax=Zizania palustris TaxID=103762 RepID=A0A8J5TJ17_ZIZPA|nr:hypothetical protein GUJ93_ZPchr0007g6349 [Zizania palustris]
MSSSSSEYRLQTTTPKGELIGRKSSQQDREKTRRRRREITAIHTMQLRVERTAEAIHPAGQAAGEVSAATGSCLMQEDDEWMDGWKQQAAGPRKTGRIGAGAPEKRGDLKGEAVVADTKGSRLLLEEEDSKTPKVAIIAKKRSHLCCTVCSLYLPMPAI